MWIGSSLAVIILDLFSSISLLHLLIILPPWPLQMKKVGCIVKKAIMD